MSDKVFDALVTKSFSEAKNHGVFKVAKLAPRVMLKDILKNDLLKGIPLPELQDVKITIWLSPYFRANEADVENVVMMSFPAMAYVKTLARNFPMLSIDIVHPNYSSDQSLENDWREYHDESSKYLASAQAKTNVIYADDPLLLDLSGIKTEKHLPPYFDFLAKVADGDFPNLRDTKIVGLERSTVSFATLHVVKDLPKSVLDNPNFEFSASLMYTPESLTSLIQGMILGSLAKGMNAILSMPDMKDDRLDKEGKEVLDKMKELFERITKHNLAPAIIHYDKKERFIKLTEALGKASDAYLNGESFELKGTGTTFSVRDIEGAKILKIEKEGDNPTNLVCTDLSRYSVVSLDYYAKLLSRANRKAEAEVLKKECFSSDLFLLDVQSFTLSPDTYKATPLKSNKFEYVDCDTYIFDKSTNKSSHYSEIVSTSKGKSRAA